uniref:Uncharacterized protein n=1 Tax=Pygocentrus nattereri TaxID=42514 RepID=A0A3B4C3E2_PYGNA
MLFLISLYFWLHETCIFDKVFCEDNSKNHLNTVFQVLQRLDLLPTSGPPLSKPSVYFPTDVANAPLSSGFPRNAWWWHPEILHPEMRKRHNLASYNLNSFGLRYGK